MIFSPQREQGPRSCPCWRCRLPEPTHHRAGARGGGERESPPPRPRPHLSRRSTMIATLRPAAALASAAVLLAALAPLTAQDGGKYTIKQAKLDPPAELKPAVAKVLGPEAVQLLDGSGNAVCDV